MGIKRVERVSKHLFICAHSEIDEPLPESTGLLLFVESIRPGCVLNLGPELVHFIFVQVEFDSAVLSTHAEDEGSVSARAWAVANVFAPERGEAEVSRAIATDDTAELVEEVGVVLFENLNVSF
ncbi:hypothetical protein C475_18721 [Halosimplex carlsbadense 2-9-1]|uniref:Uncharacterized protein n=1 Tax=Halosimplex carlsbadense 2-9-1 TaxID=797114 RepID=M0CE00_9EURY|nr:hypothetical protein C475_18721 [Halosimplex carlsbadense 2-9-1]